MAEGRMLKKRISKSKKFANLKNDRTMTLYLMLLPHLDVEGRIEADPDIIKGVVCPYIKSQTNRGIAESLKDMQRVGLIILYESKGEKFLQFTRFDDFQSLQKNKEAASHIPPPSPELLQSCSGLDIDELPDKLNLREVKDKEREKESLIIFCSALEIYPGSKRSPETEFKELTETHADWKEVLALLKPAIENQIKSREILKSKKRLVPEWKTFTNWIVNRCWEEVTEAEREAEEIQKRQEQARIRAKEKYEEFKKHFHNYIMETDPEILRRKCRSDGNLAQATKELRPEVFQEQAVK